MLGVGTALVCVMERLSLKQTSAPLLESTYDSVTLEMRFVICHHLVVRPLRSHT